jgi:hypothetical protein
MRHPGAVDVIDRLLSNDLHTLEFHDAAKAVELTELGAVLALAEHGNPDVRRNLASALPFLTDEDPTPNAIVDCAIAMSCDPSPDVRDWACCALGTQFRGIDTPELREALVDRLDDIHTDARCEAMLGLAYRRDPRVLPYIRHALSRPSGQLYQNELIAAGAFSDPELHDLVLRHVPGWPTAQANATADVVRRLTDPDGPGDDVFDGVAELYRRRAYGLGDGDSLKWWRIMDEMLDIAPYRAEEFMAATSQRLADDERGLDELLHRSGLT